ncbi:hypothetical protein [Clostridium botulinum]|nr:hypothetical protein [Clostridium botulinum]
MENDKPGIVLYKNGLAQGYFDIEYCSRHDTKLQFQKNRRCKLESCYKIQ